MTIRLSRRTLMTDIAFGAVGGAGAGGSWYSARASSKCLIVGAIRWMGGTDGRGVTRYRNSRLAKPVKVAVSGSVERHSDRTNRLVWTSSQEKFDAEIVTATQGGLSYWAYLTAGKNGIIDMRDPMMMGLALHRSSKVANRINWCLMLSNGNMGDQGHYDASSRAVRDLILDPNYQLVSNSKPLLYIYYTEQDLARFLTDPLQV